MHIQETHQGILAAIREDGARVGIACYRIHADSYESLPHHVAQPLWRKIFDEIEKKECMSPLSVLAISDPFLGKDPFSRTQCEFQDAVAYRESYQRQDDNLDVQMANFILDTYDNGLRLIDMASRGEIPVAKPEN